MNINFRTILAKAKSDVAAFEQKVETGITDILLSSTSIIDKFAAWVQTSGVTGEQLLITDLESPIAKTIAGYIPNGTQYLTEIVALLNRVAPIMLQAKDEAIVFDGAMHHLAAEITSILHGGELTNLVL